MYFNKHKLLANVLDYVHIYLLFNNIGAERMLSAQNSFQRRQGKNKDKLFYMCRSSPVMASALSMAKL